MNIFDDMPAVPACPHCGHSGDGLQWAFPDPIGKAGVQCACLACGAHGPARADYNEAVAAFASGEVEARAA